MQAHWRRFQFLTVRVDGNEVILEQRRFEFIVIRVDGNEETLGKYVTFEIKCIQFLLLGDVVGNLISHLFFSR